MSRSVCMHASELLLAMPPEGSTDIYTVHQLVWTEVDNAMAIQHRPSILYRQDGHAVRVRVRDCAMRRGASVSAKVFDGQTMQLACRIAPWREAPFGVSPDMINWRVRQLLTQAGLEIDGMRWEYLIARGHKQTRGNSHAIALPIVDLHANVRVLNAEKAGAAWVDGIGRGRRFGFGMPLFK